MTDWKKLQEQTARSLTKTDIPVIAEEKRVSAAFAKERSLVESITGMKFGRLEEDGLQTKALVQAGNILRKRVQESMKGSDVEAELKNPNTLHVKHVVNGMQIGEADLTVTQRGQYIVANANGSATQPDVQRLFKEQEAALNRMKPEEILAFKEGEGEKPEDDDAEYEEADVAVNEATDTEFRAHGGQGVLVRKNGDGTSNVYLTKGKKAEKGSGLLSKDGRKLSGAGKNAQRMLNALKNDPVGRYKDVELGEAEQQESKQRLVPVGQVLGKKKELSEAKDAKGDKEQKIDDSNKTTKDPMQKGNPADKLPKHVNAAGPAAETAKKTVNAAKPAPGWAQRKVWPEATTGKKMMADGKKDKRWGGHGYLGAAKRSTLADKVVAEAIERAGLTYEEAFAWMNSRPGREAAEALSEGKMTAVNLSESMKTLLKVPGDRKALAEEVEVAEVEQDLNALLDEAYKILDGRLGWIMFQLKRMGDEDGEGFTKKKAVEIADAWMTLKTLVEDFDEVDESADVSEAGEAGKFKTSYKVLERLMNRTEDAVYVAKDFAKAVAGTEYASDARAIEKGLAEAWKHVTATEGAMKNESGVNESDESDNPDESEDEKKKLGEAHPDFGDGVDGLLKASESVPHQKKFPWLDEVGEFYAEMLNGGIEQYANNVGPGAFRVVADAAAEHSPTLKDLFREHGVNREWIKSLTKNLQSNELSQRAEKFDDAFYAVSKKVAQEFNKVVLVQDKGSN